MLVNRGDTDQFFIYDYAKMPGALITVDCAKIFALLWPQYLMAYR